jgi:hypothetical protein
MLLLLAAALATAAPAVADVVREGTTPGGAFYKIVVPDGWQGDLVIWNHGFDLAAPGPVEDLGPLAELQLAQGFAVAASSYRLDGWALFRTNRDLKALAAVFRAEFGEPREVLLYGASLGGLVTLRAVERARGGLGNVVGALSYCGAVAGSRNWDAALDLRLLYDVVCRDLPEAAIPGGGAGLPEGSGFTTGDLEAAVDACTGVLHRPSQRTPQQKARLRDLLELARLPEEFLVTDMGYATFALSDLIHDRRKLRGKQGVGNADVDYGDAAIDAAIERVAPRPGAARRLRKNYTPSGNLGPVKVVALHTDKDGLVVVENEAAYLEKAPADRLTVGVAIESEPSHCGFSPAEVLAGWAELLDWVEDERQPSAADLQVSCQQFAALVPGPCRIDPAFVIPDLDDRIRPR